MAKRMFMKSKVQEITRKELFVLIHEQSWQEKGIAIKAMREAYGVNATDMAHNIGISRARLKRFETGQPVNDAKLIEASCRNYFKYLNLNKIIRESLENI